MRKHSLYFPLYVILHSILLLCWRCCREICPYYVFHSIRFDGPTLSIVFIMVGGPVLAIVMVVQSLREQRNILHSLAYLFFVEFLLFVYILSVFGIWDV